MPLWVLALCMDLRKTSVKKLGSPMPLLGVFAGLPGLMPVVLSTSSLHIDWELGSNFRLLFILCGSDYR